VLRRLYLRFGAGLPVTFQRRFNRMQWSDRHLPSFSWTDRVAGSKAAKVSQPSDESFPGPASCGRDTAAASAAKQGWHHLQRPREGNPPKSPDGPQECSLDPASRSSNRPVCKARPSRPQVAPSESDNRMTSPNAAILPVNRSCRSARCELPRPCRISIVPNSKVSHAPAPCPRRNPNDPSLVRRWRNRGGVDTTQ
jgi:hypothetical protein